MAAFGLVADVPDAATSTADKVYLWPCNVRVWGLWQHIQTLWRSGVGGREGLDYAGLAVYLRDVARIKPRHFPDTFTCIQAMERAALDEWAKQREKSA
jgi:hypothetical protein